MALNYPGPYVVTIHYTSGGLEHVMNLNLNMPILPSVGQDPATFEVTLAGGGTAIAQTAFENFVTLLAPFYNVSSKFDYFDLWSVAPNSYDRTYITSGVLDIDGTSSTPTTYAAQLIFTLRTAEGGKMQLHMMETISTPGAAVKRAYFTGVILSLATFLEGELNWLLAKDTSYPTVCISYLPGQNEALFKKRYRSQ